MEINLFWILVVIFFIYLVKTNGNRYLKKAVGSFLIVLGLFVFSPLPSIDDLILFPLFSSFIGNDLTIEGIKKTFLPYSVVTAMVGLTIAYTGIWISGLKLKDLKNRIKIILKKII